MLWVKEPPFYCLREHIQGPVFESCGYKFTIWENENIILLFWQVGDMILLSLCHVGYFSFCLPSEISINYISGVPY